MTLDDALAAFLVQLDADGRSPHTIRQYRRHLGELRAWLDREGRGLDLGAINHQVLARFLAAPGTKQGATGGARKGTSLNALRTSLRCFFAYLHESGLIPMNPARLLRRAIAPPAAPRALSEAEEGRLLAVLNDADARDRMLFRLMLKTGIRLSTALALDAEDLDLDGGVMAVWMKGDRRERMAIPEGVAQELGGFLGGRQRGPVFRGRGGERLGARQAQRRFRELAEEAGIGAGASPHALRHTFATRLYASSKDILTVKRALRHRSIGSTLCYAESVA